MAKVGTFFLLCLVGGPVAVDVLAQEWDFKLAYGFPPLGILANVLKKIEASRGRYIITAPFWVKWAWFSPPWALSVEPPLQGRADILQQQGIHHPHSELAAWILSEEF